MRTGLMRAVAAGDSGKAVMKGRGTVFGGLHWAPRPRAGAGCSLAGAYVCKLAGESRVGMGLLRPLLTALVCAGVPQALTLI